MNTLQDARGTFRVYKIRCICRVCRKLRIVEPLYRTTSTQRERMKTNYVCSDHKDGRRRHSRNGQVRCELCAPLRCRVAT